MTLKKERNGKKKFFCFIRHNNTINCFIAGSYFVDISERTFSSLSWEIISQGHLGRILYG